MACDFHCDYYERGGAQRWLACASLGVEGAEHRKKKTLPVNWLLKQNWLLSVWLSINSQFTVKVFIRVHRSLASRLHAVCVSRSSARRLTAARLQND